MENVFIIAVATVVLFAILKFLENKYLDNSEYQKPLKEIVRDIVIVFVASVVASFGYFHFQSYIRDFFNIVTETPTLTAATTQIFTDNPGF
jgi:uncharacterized membrane protein